MRNRTGRTLTLLLLALAWGCSHPTELDLDSWPGFEGLWVATVAAEGAPADALDAWTLRLEQDGQSVEGDLVRVPYLEQTPERYRVVGTIGPDSELEGDVIDEEGERVLSWRARREGEALVANTFGIYFEFLRSYGSGFRDYSPPEGGTGFAAARR